MNSPSFPTASRASRSRRCRRSSCCLARYCLMKLFWLISSPIWHTALNTGSGLLSTDREQSRAEQTPAYLGVRLQTDMVSRGFLEVLQHQSLINAHTEINQGLFSCTIYELKLLTANKHTHQERKSTSKNIIWHPVNCNITEIVKKTIIKVVSLKPTAPHRTRDEGLSLISPNLTHNFIITIKVTQRSFAVK